MVTERFRGDAHLACDLRGPGFVLGQKKRKYREVPTTRNAKRTISAGKKGAVKTMGVWREGGGEGVGGLRKFAFRKGARGPVRMGDKGQELTPLTIQGTTCVRAGQTYQEKCLQVG